MVDAQSLLLLFAGGGGQVFIANSLFGPKLSNNGDEMAETKLERESNKFFKKAVHLLDSLFLLRGA